MSELASIEVTPEEEVAVAKGLETARAVAERFRRAKGDRLFISMNTCDCVNFQIKSVCSAWYPSETLADGIAEVLHEMGPDFRKTKAERLRRRAAELEAEAAKLERGE